MATPYFVADAASVTVLRSLASTSFGKYNLTLPDGVDLEDVYEVSAEGNELAYVASLGARRRVGGMFRRFVRADVNVTADGEDMVPASDVERVLNDAEKRVSGDFFLESDITRAGLGPWRPFVDFNVGDIANVEIWGRVVPLVVTRIEPKRTEHSDEDWAVHVGGQLLSDAEARLAENADIYNAVVSDRRDLAGLDGKIRTETNNRKAAVSAEREARVAGDEALSDRIDGLPTSEMLNAEIVEVNRQLTALGGAQDEARREVMEDLNGRIAGLNRDLTLLKQEEINDLQGKWNAQQDEINAQNSKFRELQTVINDKQTGINALNDKFKAEQLKTNKLNDDFRAEQTKINTIQGEAREADRKALDAMGETVKLQHLNNHGSWYINGSLPARSANYRMSLPYAAPRVTPVGCRQFYSNEHSYIEFLEPGDWRVDVKFLTPLRTTLARDFVGYLELYLANENYSIVDKRTGMYNCQGLETVMLHATFRAPKAGYRIAAAYWMDKDSSLFQADNGPEYTELSVRQLSRVV